MTGSLSTATLAMYVGLVYALMGASGLAMLLLPMLLGAVVLWGTFFALIAGSPADPWRYAWRGLLAGMAGTLAYSVGAVFAGELVAEGALTYGPFGIVVTFVVATIFGAPLLPAGLAWVTAVFSRSRLVHGG